MLLHSPFTHLPFLFPDDGGGAAGDAGHEGGRHDDQHGGAGQDGAEDVAGLKSALEKERADRKTFEKQFRDAAKRLADLENAGKSDLEKLTGERDALRSQIDSLFAKVRDATSRTAVYEAATKANAINATAIVRLVRDDLEFDEDGQPVNVTQAVAAAKRDYPELFRATQGSGDGGKGNGSPTTQDINSLIRSMAVEAS